MAVIICALTVPGDTEWLTRKAADHAVNWREIFSTALVYVFELWSIWPMFGKHGAAERVFLDLPGTAHSCSFKAKVNSSDAGEE